jgi:hypothetical protein
MLPRLIPTILFAAQFLFCAYPAPAQSSASSSSCPCTLQGSVVDSISGQPVPHALVRLSAPSPRATLTDSEGKNSNGAPTHGTCEAADFAHITIGRYGKVRLHRAWDHSGGYANIKYFHLTKKMYDNKEMLGQFGDFSGHWTPEQLAIIHRQGMPE